MTPTKRSARPSSDLALAANAKRDDSISGLLARPDIKQAIQLALPSFMTPDRLLRIALTECRRTPALAQCDQSSLLQAIFQCAQLGLEPGSALGHAYLIPYGKQCQFQLGYRGMIDLARRSGKVISIDARCVYEGDQFECELGLENNLRHVPDWQNPNRSDDSKLTFVYAVAKLADGGVQFEVLSRTEIEQTRKRAKASGSGPWQTDFAAMAKKTAVRRLFKWLPISIDVDRAVGNDERGELGLTQETQLDEVLPVESVEVQTIEPAAAVEKPVLSERQLGILRRTLSTRLPSQAAQQVLLADLKLGAFESLKADDFDALMEKLSDPDYINSLINQAKATEAA